jgi:hypothetical protein
MCNARLQSTFGNYELIRGTNKPSKQNSIKSDIPITIHKCSFIFFGTRTSITGQTKVSWPTDRCRNENTSPVQLKISANRFLHHSKHSASPLKRSIQLCSFRELSLFDHGNTGMDFFRVPQNMANLTPWAL